MEGDPLLCDHCISGIGGWAEEKAANLSYKLEEIKIDKVYKNYFDTIASSAVKDQSFLCEK